MAEKRLRKELKDVLEKNMKCFQVLDATDLFSWKGLITPDFAPYNRHIFKIEIKFPNEYPFRKPAITFLTKIYHPNINESGNFDMEMICPHVSELSPAIWVVQLMKALMDILKEPDHMHSILPELFQEFKSNREKFFKNAVEYTSKFSENMLPEQSCEAEGKSPSVEKESEQKSCEDAEGKYPRVETESEQKSCEAEGKCQRVDEESSELLKNAGKKMKDLSDTKCLEQHELEGKCPHF